MPHLHEVGVEAQSRKMWPKPNSLGSPAGSRKWLRGRQCLLGELGQSPSNRLYLGRFHFLLEEKEEIFVFLCCFPLSGRPATRSRQIHPVEKKEAMAGWEQRGPLPKSHRKTPGETLPLKEREKGFI